MCTIFLFGNFKTVYYDLVAYMEVYTVFWFEIHKVSLSAAVRSLCTYRDGNMELIRRPSTRLPSILLSDVVLTALIILSRVMHLLFQSFLVGSTKKIHDKLQLQDVVKVVVKVFQHQCPDLKYAPNASRVQVIAVNLSGEHHYSLREVLRTATITAN